MHLQVRIVLAMLLLAVLAIGTGTALLLGYAFAAFSIGVIIFIMASRIADARLARLGVLPRAAATSGTNNDEHRLAA